jgi:hypothetical protein
METRTEKGEGFNRSAQRLALSERKKRRIDKRIRIEELRLRRGREGITIGEIPGLVIQGIAGSGKLILPAMEPWQSR